jgi:photosystem II stability/assembly factor-like uncharacterized protein
MRTAILLFLNILFSIQPVKSQLKVHHQTLSLSPINPINENQFYATLGGLGHTIFTKVTLEPLNYEYLELIEFDINMTSYALIGKKGWSVDYQGAVYITNDGFQTTEKLTDRKYKKLINTNSGIVALGTDNKIYFSDDAVNWTYKANSSTLNVKGQIVWGTSNDNQLMISQDGGKTWESSIDLSQFNNLKTLDVVNPSTIVVLADSKLRITTNKGETWKITNKAHSQLQQLTFIDADFGFNNMANVGIEATNNGGDTWVSFAQIFPILPKTGTVQLWAVMQGKIFISIDGNLYYTKDKGQTWTFFHSMIGGNYDVHQKGNVVIIGGSNGSYAISKDGGMIFHADKWGNEDIMAVAVIDENTYALGDRKGQVLMLYDGGSRWGKKTTSTGNYNALHFETSADKKVVLSTRVGQPAISTDAAQNFKYVTVGGGTRFQTMKPNGDIIDVNQGGIISTVNKSNGQKTELIRIEGANVKRISMATDNVGYVFSFKDGSTMNTYVTKNGWATYTPGGEVKIPQVGGYLSVSHVGPGHVIVTADGVNTTFETTDFGTTWTNKNLGLLNTFANRVNPVAGSHFNSTNKYWLVSETGYLFWANNEFSTPTSATKILAAQEKNLFVYPNPATQNINIQVKNMEIANIEIFNLRGQKVFKQNTPLSHPIDISSWGNEFYIVKLTSTNGQTAQTKFIKN